VNILFIFIAIGFIALCFLYLYNVARFKRCGFIGGLLLFIFTTPFIGYFIIEMLPLKNQKTCKWCGNKNMETEYCGVCKKNESGETLKA
jgi:hypothetical protein